MKRQGHGTMCGMNGNAADAASATRLCPRILAACILCSSEEFTVHSLKSAWTSGNLMMWAIPIPI